MAPTARADTTTATEDPDNTTQALASAGTGNGTITITLPTAYQGTSSSQSFNYKVYKLFDATVDTTQQGNNPTAYTYSLESGKNDVPQINGDVNKFIKDDANNIYYGKLQDNEPTEGTHFQVKINGQNKWLVPKTGAMTTDEAEAANTAIKKYLNLDGTGEGAAASPVADVDVANTFSTLKITGLGYGYYYITTTAGTAIALTSTNPNATIDSKNDVPSIDKTITKVDDGVTNSTNTKGSVGADGKNAIAELNSTVHYKSVIHVKKGATNYVFRDKMESALAFDTSSIKVQTKVGDATAQDVNPTNNINVSGTDTNTYKATTIASTSGDDQYTFKIEFDNTWVSNLASKTGDNGSTDVQIIITYTARVTSAALQNDPADNSATISYGNDPSHTSDPSVTHVYNAKFTVTKHVYNNGQSGAALAGAEFVLKNSSGKYYKYAPETSGEEATPAMVEWVENERDATVFQSDSNGAVKSKGDTISPALDGFVGLADGTYTLHETKAPDGYNRAEDSSFTVKTATEENALEPANLSQSKDILDRAGTELPTTGGPGTTALYVVGAILVLAAGIGLVARRRMRQH